MTNFMMLPLAWFSTKTPQNAKEETLQGKKKKKNNPASCSLPEYCSLGFWSFSICSCTDMQLRKGFTVWHGIWNRSKPKHPLYKNSLDWKQVLFQNLQSEVILKDLLTLATMGKLSN